MFTDHWINAYPISAGTSNPQSLSKNLTYDEESALWYVGGYLIKSLCDKIIKSHDATELLLVLEAFKESDELTDDETSDDTKQQTMETSDDTQQTMETIDDTQQTMETCEDTCRQQTKEWFNTINRGGLT